jgi:hypothetical protein
MKPPPLELEEAQPDTSRASETAEAVKQSALARVAAAPGVVVGVVMRCREIRLEPTVRAKVSEALHRMLRGVYPIREGATETAPSFTVRWHSQ